MALVKRVYFFFMKNNLWLFFLDFCVSLILLRVAHFYISDRIFPNLNFLNVLFAIFVLVFLFILFCINIGVYGDKNETDRNKISAEQENIAKCFLSFVWKKFVVFFVYTFLIHYAHFVSTFAAQVIWPFSDPSDLSFIPIIYDDNTVLYLERVVVENYIYVVAMIIWYILHDIYLIFIITVSAHFFILYDLYDFSYFFNKICDFLIKNYKFLRNLLESKIEFLFQKTLSFKIFTENYVAFIVYSTKVSLFNCVVFLKELFIKSCKVFFVEISLKITKLLKKTKDFVYTLITRVRKMKLKKKTDNEESQKSQTESKNKSIKK